LFPPPVLAPPPKHRAPEVDRERDIASCRFYKTIGELQDEMKNVDGFFQKACATPEFAKGWVESGFQGPTFHPNNTLSWERKKKFLKALEELPDDACIGVVFHGTSPQNIPPILKDGLDPTKRRGQGYGPGEYFSKNPSVSVSYCKGGMEMLVFLVVLPSTLPLPEPKKSDESPPVQYHPAARPRVTRRPRMVPPYFVVVENNDHQIPIGTVQFESVDGNVITESQRKANKLKALNKKFQEATQAVKETQLKAEIIQDLIAYKVDVASEKYQKHRSSLSETSKREIAWYVHHRVDEDVIFCYFEDLPEPMDQEEFHRANIPSVDQTLENEVKAKDDLVKAKTEGSRIPSPTSGNESSS
jgi:Poly(ADP-ribose) polymerase catalytic domain